MRNTEKNTKKGYNSENFHIYLNGPWRTEEKKVELFKK